MAYEDGSSDPYSLLEFRTAKHASLATELHLAKRGITRIANFETFVSLDTLWLNDNKISSLRGLDQVKNTSPSAKKKKIYPVTIPIVFFA